VTTGCNITYLLPLMKLVVCSRARDAELLEEVLQWHANNVVLVVKRVIKPCTSKTVTMRLDRIEGRYFVITKTHYLSENMKI
jgi:hypothetical protein